MAEIKKYLDTAALGTLVEKIKSEDAKVLTNAKSYADSLASNYDAAGAAAGVQTKLDEEIARAKAAEKVNADAIAGIKDGANLDSFADVEAEIAKYQLAGDYATKAEAQGYANAKDEAIAAAQKAGDDAQTDLDTFKNTVSSTYETKADATAKLTEAKGYTDDEIAKVDAKVAENAGDIEELAGKVAALEAGTYDDTEVRGLIKANADAIDLVEADVATIKGDYLKASDKEDVLAAVNTEKERAMGVEGGLEDRIETMEAFWEAAQADGTDSNVIDTLKEIQEDIAGDESGASEMAASIKQNADDIDALEGRMDTAEGDIDAVEDRVGVVETKLATIAEGAQVNVIETVKVNGEALTITDKAVDVIVPTGALASKDKVAEADLETALATKINGKADQTALEDAVDVLEAVDAGLDERLQAVEAQLGDGENSVSDLISTAKQEAIDAAALDATTKANQALVDAKAYADEEDAKIELRVDALEAKAHEHANKAELDLIASGDKAKWDEAAAKAHEHANQTVLDGITADKVAVWDTVSTKASQEDLDDAIELINANTSAINSFVAITSSEVEALFA